MIQRALLLLCTLLAPSFAAAQATGAIAGVVTDEREPQPIPQFSPWKILPTDLPTG